MTTATSELVVEPPISTPSSIALFPKKVILLCWLDGAMHPHNTFAQC